MCPPCNEGLATYASCPICPCKSRAVGSTWGGWAYFRLSYVLKVKWDWLLPEELEYPCWISVRTLVRLYLSGTLSTLFLHLLACWDLPPAETILVMQCLDKPQLMQTLDKPVLIPKLPRLIIGNNRSITVPIDNLVNQVKMVSILPDY